MGLFKNLFNQKQEPVIEEEEEEEVKGITPEIQELIDQEKWEEIFEHKIYEVYHSYNIEDIRLMIFDEFCKKYPNLMESARRYLWINCDSTKGYHEVPINSYMRNGEFDYEFFLKTYELHNYNPLLNFIRDAKDITFSADHIICLNNMWADKELKEYDFFKEVDNWLDDPSLFIAENDSEGTEKLIMLKKLEGGK